MPGDEQSTRFKRGAIATGSPRTGREATEGFPPSPAGYPAVMSQPDPYPPIDIPPSPLPDPEPLPEPPSPQPPIPDPLPV